MFAIHTLGAPHNMTAWIKFAGLAVVIMAAWWGVSSLDAERYLTPAVLIQWLNDAGPLGPLLLIGGMVCAVIIPPIPSLPLDLAAGAVFGPFYGALYAVIGAEIGAIACFIAARVLGRDALSRLLTVDATFCQLCTDHQLMWLIFFARLIPVFSFDVVSYGAGLTHVSLRTFALATFFGMAPPTFVFTYVGSSAASAQWLLVAGGVVMATMLLAMPKLVMKYRTSMFAQLVLGPPPIPIAVRKEIPLQIRCLGCGAVCS
jgi:uncharacterized membrane protein YdjX (TVP38/TMEM64 family)